MGMSYTRLSRFGYDNFYSEIWHKSDCPKCQSVNWYYMACVPMDLSTSDYDGFRCHKCGHIVVWDREDENEDEEIDVDELYLTDGEAMTRIRDE